MLIHAGTKEILLRDAQQLYDRMLQEGTDVTLHVFEGMWHVWHLFGVPEAGDAMEQISDFLHEKLQWDDSE